MTKPGDHLIRTSTLESGMLALSELSGLSRLGMEMHRLAPKAELPIAAGTERFIYVLEGSGQLHAHLDASSTEAALGAGDFVALAPDEAAVLGTEQGISILLGSPR